MNFLPIVERELRVASRRRGTYWLRSGVALGVTAGCAWIFLVMSRASSREVGQVLFYALTGGALLYCLGAGLRSTADCLSQEKREGTLGLLFLTDLKGYDVVGGKLAANSMNACYGLLAIVPVLGLPLLLGGVTPGEFGRMAVVLVDALFLSLSVGMFASAISRSWRMSSAITFLLMLLFTAGFPALGAWVAYVSKWNNPKFEFFLPSAGYAFEMAQDVFFKRTPMNFYWSIGTIHALGWIFFGLAALIAPRSWQDRPAGARVLRWRGYWEGWSFGNSTGRQTFRERLLDQNAFYWLAARARLKPASVWGVLGVLAGGWGWGALKFQKDWFNEVLYILTAIILNMLLKGWLAMEAGRQLSEDRSLGALELLLSTPLTVPEILRGQRLALQRQFFKPFIAILVVEFTMLVATPHDLLFSGERTQWIAVWLAGMFMLPADAVALYWVGMWMGLAAKTPRLASSSTAARVLVLPWIGFAVFLTFAGLMSAQYRQELSWQVYLGVWIGLGLITDLGFGFWARHNLLTRFRELAAQRYQPKMMFWKRLLGKRGGI